MNIVMSRGNRLPIAACLTLLTLALVLLAVAWSPAQRYQNLISVSWGDGTQGKALYGAYVHAEPEGTGVRVIATIYVGRPTLWQSYEHKPIDLGLAADDIEAVSRWGRIEWSEQGVTIGAGPHARLIPRIDLENHR